MLENVTRPRRLWLLLLLSLGLFGVSFPAAAHSSIQGAGDFISGIFHPVTTPSHVLLMVALGLLAGRRPPLDLKTPMTVFIPMCGLALLLTNSGWVKEVYPPLIIGLALCAGALLALDKDAIPWAGRVLFAAGGLALGLDSGVEPAASTLKIIKTLLGTWISLVVLVCDVAIYVSLGAEAKWLQIALRVAGSWIIAIALLVLAFSLRPA